MAHVDELFPQGVAKGSRGGPRMNLSVIELPSGGQERARRWPSFRWEYDAGIGIQSFTDLDQVYAHHLAVGPENSFPFKDEYDFTSRSDNRSDPVTTGTLDQVIAVGGGGVASFQLIKTYTFGTRSYVRSIRKPESGSVFVSVDGVVKTAGTQYLLDLSTGTITFTAGNIPNSGAIITASFKFRVPVFYGKEFGYKTSLDAIKAGRVPEIPLVEDTSESSITPDFPYLGGGDTITLTSDALYSYTWGSSVTFIPDADGRSVILPDINDLPFGGPIFNFFNFANSGPKTIAFKNRATGATEFSLAFSKGATVLVRRDSGGNKAWLAIQ